jgi:phosphoglycolate phosphatase
MIGAPLSTIFETLLRSSEPDLLDRAVAAYRVRFDRTGIFENCLFPGVVEALTTLRQAGHSLQIVTAKPAVAARRVVEHFEIGRFFEAVHGPDLDERLFEKARLLETAVRGVPAGQSVMVGDRADDVRAAHACGVQAVAAAWGYGAREELRAANPTYVAESMAELVDWVLSW